MLNKTISIIGLGYIGLPTAAVFANCKIKVIGVDIKKEIVDTINRGQIHIVEPGLDLVVKSAVSEGYLRAATEPESAEAYLITVPTPFKAGKNGEHEPDLRFIEAATIAIAPKLKKGDLIVLESTSPVGTTEQMSNWLGAMRTDLTFPQTHGINSDIRIAYCPERVLPGNVLRELVQNDRIIGGMTKKCSEAAAELYKLFVEGECVITSARAAEMCKLTENAFRDVNIAFANELSIICDDLNINVWELIRLANHHPRVNILQPGPGVGGHCIAVDPWFIVDKSPASARIIRTAREVNDHKPYHVIEKVKNAAAKYNNPKIACLGLTFKADIDDLRESPSLQIVQELRRMDIGTLYVCEPHIEELPPDLLNKNIYLMPAEEAINKSDIVLILVNHRIFYNLNIGLLSGKDVIDSRGMWM